MFCALYDRLDDNSVRDQGATWLADHSIDSNALRVANDIVDGRTAPGRVYTRGINAGDAAAAFTVVHGLDRALGRINPRLRGADPTPRALLKVESRLRQTGRLNTDATEGALLPELAHRRPPGPPNHKRDLLRYVRRVPADSWQQVDLRLVAPSRRLRARDLRDGLDVACVPVIADPDEMTFATRTAPGGPVYRIAPRDLGRTRARIEEIVVALDAAGAQLALAPELTLSPALLETWQAVLRSCRSRRLRYVVVGTGNLDPAGDRAANTAVLLDGATGAEIGRQPKLYGFAMDADVLERWQLRSRLGAIALAEDLQPPAPRLTVFDLGAVRMAMLICEDLNKPLDLGPLIRDLGISLLLVPVFSRPVKARRWEQTAAAVHVRETGASVIVANSLVMATILATADPATALVVPAVGESALLGHASGPAGLARFRLQPDGTVESL